MINCVICGRNALLVEPGSGSAVCPQHATSLREDERESLEDLLRILERVLQEQASTEGGVTRCLTCFEFVLEPGGFFCSRACLEAFAA